MHRALRYLCLSIMLALLGLPPTLAPTHSALAAPDDPTIVGGDPVPDPNPYVWQVKLNIYTTTGSKIGCGGSVLSDRWILTAAHCIKVGAEIDTVEVIVGQRVLSQAPTTHIFAAQRGLIHPLYNAVTFAHDIALLELDTPIPNAAMYVVPLMTKGLEESTGAAGTIGTVTGWGHMIPNNPLSSPDTLMYLDTPIVAQNSCRDAWSTVGVDILDSMICSGFVEGGKSSCQGDSGGPLVVTDKYGNYTQSGIVSFGPGSCAEPNRVPVYTRVSSYIDWIQTQTGLDFTTPRAPDLVVDGIVITNDGLLGIQISNVGTARVALDQGFWVDLYIGPDRAPVKVNEIWQAVGQYGAVWGVDRDGFVLLPGKSITLILGDIVYWPTHSRLPLIRQNGNVVLDISPETPLYAQVDSANAYSNYGAIMELHELHGGPYNNIAGPFYLTAQEVRVSGSVMTHELYLPMVAGSPQQPSAQSAQRKTTDKYELDRLSPLLNLLPARIKTTTED